MKSGVQVAIQVAKSLARFIEPMECLPVPKLPAGHGWLYELLCGPPHKSSSVAFGVMWRHSSDMADKTSGVRRGAT